MKIINEDFEIHDTLNPLLWDTTTKKLLPDAREKIVEIVDAFENTLKVPVLTRY